MDKKEFMISVFEAAIEGYESGKLGWCRGELAIDASGEYCSAVLDDAVCVCALGGIEREYFARIEGKPKDVITILDLDMEFEEYLKKTTGRGEIPKWNDSLVGTDEECKQQVVEAYRGVVAALRGG